jgi:hypothetical protein
MLNAAHEQDNARLFSYDDTDGPDLVTRQFGEGFAMITTKDVKEGEQIVSPVPSTPVPYPVKVTLKSSSLRLLSPTLTSLIIISSTPMLHLPIRNSSGSTVMSTSSPSGLLSWQK